MVPLLEVVEVAGERHMVLHRNQLKVTLEAVLVRLDQLVVMVRLELLL
jgi:hypothetical protein